MMISPALYAEEYFVGKSPDDILAAIHELQSEIEQLKETAENPAYYNLPHDCPNDLVRILCNREYLEEAKKALEAAGGKHAPTKLAQKAAAFDAALPFLRSVSFSVGGFFAGNVQYAMMVVDGKAIMHII